MDRKKLKVGFIHPKAPDTEGTGANHSASMIITALKERGHDITVYCTGEVKQPTEFDTRELDYDGTFPRQADEELNRSILQLEDEFCQYDIVHSYLMRLIPSLTLLNDINTKTIVTLNAYGGICPKNTLRYLDREECDKNGIMRCGLCTFHQGLNMTKDIGMVHRMLQVGYHPIRKIRRLRLLKQGERDIEYIDRFHALSKHVKTTYGDFGFPQSKIKVIPNILDEDFLIQHESDFQPPYRALYVGFLGEHKGVERLIPLVSRLREQGRDIRLTIVGGGDLKMTLEKRIEAKGLQSSIELTGHIPYNSLPKIYASHDLFVYPGIWDEPFGRVFLESLAAGTPVVATDVGATEEIIGNGGIVVENSIESLVGGVEKMLESGNLIEYSTHGRSTVHRFKREEVGKQIEQLYFDAIG